MCGGREFVGDALLLLISAADWALFQKRFLSFAQKFGAEEDHRGRASSSSPVRSLHRPTSSNKGTFKRTLELYAAVFGRRNDFDRCGKDAKRSKL